MAIYVQSELDLYEAPFVRRSPFLKAVALRSMFSDIDQGFTRKVVLIEGIAGSGKTTLCWYICTEWAAGRLFEDYKVLIHIYPLVIQPFILPQS